MALTLKGKVVLVTGAGSTIGSEIVRHFSQLGASVVMTDGDHDLHIKVCKEPGSSCLAIAGSLTKAMDVINVVSQTISKYRKLDVLINCVHFPECPSEKESSLLQEFDRIMGATVRAVYHIVLLAAPYLIKSRGNVVNIITLPGIESLTNSVALVSLDQLTKSLALDLAPNGVRVNSITSDFPEVHAAEAHKSPRVFAGTGNPANSNPEDSNKSETDSAQNRVVGPGDVAESAAFLISDAAFITGASIPLTRGKGLTATLDGVQKTSAVLIDKKISNSKVENGVQKADHLTHKGDNAFHHADKGEHSIHKSETANHHKTKTESIPDGKLSDSKIDKSAGRESDKKAKEETRIDHAIHGQNHQNSTAVHGKHDVESHAKHAKTGNQGADHKLHPKNEFSRGEHGKSAK